MRQYRGLTKDGKMVYGWYVQRSHKDCCVYHYIYTGFYFEDENQEGTELEIYEVIPKTVGQSIGKLVKNKVEIYEGDVVKSETDIGVVFWHDNYAQFQIDNSITDKFVMPQDEWCNYEIIGNVWEHPHLLEKAK